MCLIKTLSTAPVPFASHIGLLVWDQHACRRHWHPDMLAVRVQLRSASIQKLSWWQAVSQWPSTYQGAQPPAEPSPLVHAPLLAKLGASRLGPQGESGWDVYRSWGHLQCNSRIENVVLPGVLRQVPAVQGCVQCAKAPDATVVFQVPALRLDQVKQADPAVSTPPIEVVIKAEPVAAASSAASQPLQPTSKPNVPQLVFLPDKVQPWQRD